MKPEYYYHEIIIYGRKLLLGGISTVVGRGTLAQLYFVSVIEAFFLMHHMRTYPYTVDKHNLTDALGHLAPILTYVSALIVRGDEEDFVHEWFPEDGYGWFICLLYVFVLPAPTIYYFMQDKGEASETPTRKDDEGTFFNPLGGDDENANTSNDSAGAANATGATQNRAGVAKLQRQTKEMRGKVQEALLENEAQRTEIKELKEQLASTRSSSGIPSSVLTTTTVDDVEVPAVRDQNDVLRAYVDDESLSEATREAAKASLTAQADSQIEQSQQVAVAMSRAAKLSDLTEERRFKGRYSQVITAAQANDGDMATAAAERAVYRAWLGTSRLLRHEVHMDKVLGRDVAMSDLKLLTQQDIDDLGAEMTRVEQARFAAAVQALQGAGGAEAGDTE